MKVYILYSSRTDEDIFVEGVFASLSALLIWLELKGFNCDKHPQLEDNSCGWFDTPSEEGVYYSYEALPLIGEVSHKTNKIEFKEV